MRLWLVILLVAIGFTIFQQDVVGHMRSIFRTVRRTASSTRTLAPKSLSTTLTSHFSIQSTNMAEACSQNPMPVLSEAGPADTKKAEELPKLSTDDFKVYNRLAVMMDAYV